MKGRRMKWIEATGGPVVLIARDDVPLWTGHEGDYDRACEVAVKGVQRVFEISDYIEAQALRRALLDFKLDCPDAAETLASDPVFARILNRLSESLKTVYDGQGEVPARRWREQHESWSSLAEREYDKKVRVNYARRMPRWHEWSEEDRREVLTILAAPYILDDEMLQELRAVVSRASEED